MSIASTTPGVRRVRHAVRTRISEHPAVYLRFARKKYPGPSPEVIGADTELVIDGYTRSASTFAVYALQLAQRRPVRLAHHLHAPAQFIEAARRRVPALLLVREPRGAILSQLVREPAIALRDALVAYNRFHACLEPHLDRMVVADFETVTHDFGSVIRRLNTRFGISLDEFVPTDASTSECFEFIVAGAARLRVRDCRQGRGPPRTARPAAATDAGRHSRGVGSVRTTQTRKGGLGRSLGTSRAHHVAGAGR